MTDITPRTSAHTIFSFESTSVRTFADDHGEPWFLANDVCAVLGYKQPRDAVSKHCREGGVAKRDTPTDSGIQEMTWINEGNLYRLIIKSRKPEAERFEQWVMEEVLPTIRKTGQYVAQPYAQNPGDALTKDQADTLRRMLTDAVKRLPKDRQAAAMIKGWSKLKAHFKTDYRHIPQAEFHEAVSIVARHVAEQGELIDAESKHDTLNETVAHLVRQIEAPNGAPVAVFMPLVNAVLRKQGFDLGARQDAILRGEQAREIEDRLGRLMGLFHPMSAPFGDALGILRALRGLHPRLGMSEPSYLPVLRRT